MSAIPQPVLHSEHEEMAEALAAAPLRDGFKVYGWLPCSITLEIPVTRFSVRELLNLQVGDIVETSTPQAIDLPLRCNGEVIGFAEFDVIGNTLAVRITELA